MSTETTNKKIKIDNGTTFGRTYTDKAVDELLKNIGGGGGSISVIELTDKNGTIASTQLGEINANPQNFAFKYNGKILLFTRADSTTYQYCNNTTNSSDNNVMTTSTLLTIQSSTGAYTIAENVHNVVANSIHPANGGDLTSIQVGSKVYSIPSGGESIPVVEGKIDSNTNKVTFNTNPTTDIFLAHLLYDEDSGLYVNSFITKSIVNFGDTAFTFYIGNVCVNAQPYIISTFIGSDFNPSLEMRILFNINPNSTAGILYLKTGEEFGIKTLEYGANGTFLKSTGNGIVWDTPSAGGSGSIPSLPADASTSTYVLKAVNGTVQWVKEA